MNRLRAFLRLSAGERRLLVEATLLLAAMRLSLRVLPLRALQRLSGSLSSDGEARHDAVSPERIAWAVGGGSRVMPGATCLTRALAIQILLERRGYRTELRVGLARTRNGEIEGHAWVEAGDKVVGAEGDLAPYTLLPLPGRSTFDSLPVRR
jgi:hypothetical protein